MNVQAAAAAAICNFHLGFLEMWDAVPFRTTPQITHQKNLVVINVIEIPTAASADPPLPLDTAAEARRHALTRLGDHRTILIGGIAALASLAD